MIIFSENKIFFDLNEIVNVVRRVLCHQKRALLKTGGARAPSAHPPSYATDRTSVTEVKLSHYSRGLRKIQLPEKYEQNVDKI
jgi:hypothetical protein